MNRVRLMTLILLLVQCVGKEESGNETLLIPIGNRCDGCVNKVVELISDCNGSSANIILTSIYSAADRRFASSIQEQYDGQLKVDSTNQYSSLDKVSVYPILLKGKKEVLTIDPNDFERKLARLRELIGCQ